MDHNPYTPPQANTETSVSPDVVGRPVAVWLLIVLLSVFAVMFLTATAQFVGAVAAHWGEIRSPVLLAVALAWRFALIVIFIAAAYGAFRGRPWTRWFGVAVIVALAAVMIFRTDTTDYANNAERAGGQLARLVVPLFLAWWTYVLALSSKVRRYFSKPPSRAA